MLTEFFALTGYMFWTVVAVVIVLDALLLAREDCEGWAISITLLWVVAVVLFSPVFHDVPPWQVLACALGYFVTGVAWSMWKWYSFNRDVIARAREQYATDSYVNKSTYPTFASFAITRRPLFMKNKTGIATWALLWPFSMSWWLLTWPRHVFKWTVDQLNVIYQQISDSVWNAVTKE